MNAPIRPIRMEPQPAVTFKAWRLPSTKPFLYAHRRELPEGIDSIEAAAQAACFAHKEGVAVVRSDYSQRPERRHHLSVFLVKRKTNPGYYRDETGKQRRKPAEYPDLVFEAFVPTDTPFIEPPDAMADPIGVDRTLIEQRA